MDHRQMLGQNMNPMPLRNAKHPIPILELPAKSVPPTENMGCRAQRYIGIFTKKFQLRPKFPGQPLDIGIQERQKLTRRQLHRRIAGCRRA